MLRQLFRLAKVLHTCDAILLQWFLYLQYYFPSIPYIYTTRGVRYGATLQVVVGGVGVGRYYRVDARVEIEGGDGPFRGAAKHVYTA